jgi:hypothetical protein
MFSKNKICIVWTDPKNNSALPESNLNNRKLVGNYGSI